MAFYDTILASELNRLTGLYPKLRNSLKNIGIKNKEEFLDAVFHASGQDEYRLRMMVDHMEDYLHSLNKYASLSLTTTAGRLAADKRPALKSGSIKSVIDKILNEAQQQPTAGVLKDKYKGQLHGNMVVKQLNKLTTQSALKTASYTFILKQAGLISNAVANPFKQKYNVERVLRVFQLAGHKNPGALRNDIMNFHKLPTPKQNILKATWNTAKNKVWSSPELRNKIDTLPKWF